ncbi:accessory Sec system glycosyltransferase GtfA [Streptococcus loxodontisalivarius]|uniref:UDP-N-acetylglucosamine--peptide N-acetylglucosaminyltransferase GtfA subunit n=1 Tax=Streptococcus loxodontisalivarius TaxID=1349415 RepID=A0ABS2PUR9_9STRE|nr:accessory Sec system glycosyltransferase GtfA [Streptococcus loxodontisalivarius]MBM7643450.1 accessory Sec system glycosylation protein GtfA [Streptococcus loxodontisalivarius]
MTVYNINLGIGWASSGVEYAQAYRSAIFKRQGIDAKFIFTDFFVQDNISDLTRNLGFSDEDIIWLYTFFTDQKVAPTTYTLADLKSSYQGELSREEKNGKQVRLFYDKDDVFLTAYLRDEDDDIVHRVEFVSKGNLVRKDFFSYTKMFTEYYAPRDNKAYLYQRRFFNEDGSIAYDEIVDGTESFFKFSDRICYSKEELIAYMMERLNLKSTDQVILDRATGTGQAVFRHVKPAKLGVVVHAEHFSENVVTDHTILWNNYYEYQFDNADKVDFFITATEAQRQLMLEQFQQFKGIQPTIYTIPVGSLDELKGQNQTRKPFSLITASRLAAEKHVDWLVNAVALAHETLPNLTFDIYGAGGEEKRLADLIAKLGAENYITLKGHKDLTDTYQDYELYLSASKSEGFGLTLLEAIGSGLPLIGFDVRYGNKTFIKDGENGYLIPVLDRDDDQQIAQAFAQRIIALYKEKNMAELQNVSYGIAEEFLTSKLEQKWANLIKEMTEND